MLPPSGFRVVPLQSIADAIEEAEWSVVRRRPRPGADEELDAEVSRLRAELAASRAALVRRERALDAAQSRIVELEDALDALLSVVEEEGT